MEVGRSARLFWTVSCLVLVFCQYCSADGRYLTNDSYVYRVKNSSDNVCMTVSLNAKIIIYYSSFNETTHNRTLEDRQFELPPKDKTYMKGNCTNSTRSIHLSWEQDGSNVTVSFNFSIEEKRWYLSQTMFEFDLNSDAFESPEVTGIQTYQTNEGLHNFNRTFNNKQYFYCKACKTLWLTDDTSDNPPSNSSGPCFQNDEKSSNSCSLMYLSNSVIFPGDLENNNDVKKKLCLEDLIDLQEIVIPAVVGGVLGLLLLVVFVSYLIAFIRRKRREGQYETLSDNY